MVCQRVYVVDEAESVGGRVCNNLFARPGGVGSTADQPYENQSKKYKQQFYACWDNIISDVIFPAISIEISKYIEIYTYFSKMLGKIIYSTIYDQCIKRPNVYFGMWKNI